MLRITIKQSALERLQKGFPWVYPHMIAKAPSVEPGECVYLVNNANKAFAIAYYHPQSKIPGRILTWDCTRFIDEQFFYEKFSQALALREKRFPVPYYRLVHAEGDHLPGLVIDRFGDTLVCQTSTAGMERLKPVWVSALEKCLNPSRIIFRDDKSIRQKEGLKSQVLAYKGELDAPITIEENETLFHGSSSDGQKTGWFYDHRANRLWVSKQVKRKTVLDLYCYHGGFGILCAKRGAKQVTLVDSSERAISFAKQAAISNAVSDQCEFITENVFDCLERYHLEQKTFDVVVVDPPAFIKQSAHKGQGLRGYLKLARMASLVVAKGGVLFIASCSHHANPAEFREAVESGIKKAQRQGDFLYKMGADKDHPIHPFLPENHYLKSLAYRLN